MTRIVRYAADPKEVRKLIAAGLALGGHPKVFANGEWEDNNGDILFARGDSKVSVNENLRGEWATVFADGEYHRCKFIGEEGSSPFRLVIDFH